MILVGLSGYAQVGKDTAAKGLARIASFERRAFADKLKALALEIDPLIEYNQNPFGGDLANLYELVMTHGWEEAKRIPEVRQFLQDLGVALRETLGEDIWIRALERTMSDYGIYVITDVRFPNEREWIKQHGGVIIQIQRPGVGRVNDHESENLVHPDGIVYNTGSPEELGERVFWLSNELHSQEHS